VAGRLDEIDVRPLVLVVMDVIGDLAEQYALRFQDPVGLANEGRIYVRKAVALLFGQPLGVHRAADGVD